MSVGAGAGRRAGAAGWRERVPLAALVLLGLVLYARGLVLGYVGDDLTALDVALRHPLGELLSGRHGPPGTWRPLGRELYFWLGGRILNLGPGGFHLVNLLIFAAATWMIARLARGWGGPRAGWLAAAAFVLFPPGSAWLAWVSCAPDLLAVFWTLAALLLHRSGRLWPAGLAAALAALAKETAVLVPVAIVVLDTLIHPASSWRARLGRLAPSLVALAVVLDLAVVTQRGWLPSGAIPAWAQARLPEAWRIPLGFARAFVPPDTGAGIARVLAEQPVWALLAAASAALALPGRTPARVARPAGARATGALRPPLVLGAILVVIGLAPLALAVEPWRGHSFALASLGTSLAAGTLLARAPAPAVRVALAATAVLHFGAGGLYRPRQTAAGPVPHPYVNYAFFRDTGALSDQLLAALAPWCPSLHALPRTFAAGVPPDAAFESVLGPGLRVTCRDTVARVRFLADFAPGDARTEFGVLRFDARTMRFVHERADARVRARVGEGFLIHARYEVAAACFEAAAGEAPDRELSYPLAVALAAAGREADARSAWGDAGRRGALLDAATMADRLLGRAGPAGAAPRDDAGRRLAPLAAGALRAPWEAEPHRALGRELLAVGRGREAALELAVAAGIGRTMPDLAWLGRGYEAMGAFEEALAAYQRALETGLRGDLYDSTRTRFIALLRRTGATLDRPQTHP